VLQAAVLQRLLPQQPAPLQVWRVGAAAAPEPGWREVAPMRADSVKRKRKKKMNKHKYRKRLRLTRMARKNARR